MHIERRCPAQPKSRAAGGTLWHCSAPQQSFIESTSAGVERVAEAQVDEGRHGVADDRARDAANAVCTVNRPEQPRSEPSSRWR